MITKDILENELISLFVDWYNFEIEKEKRGSNRGIHRRGLIHIDRLREIDILNELMYKIETRLQQHEIDK